MTSKKWLSFVPALALVIGLQFTGSAFAASELFLSAEGTKQGKFKGDSTGVAHKDAISALRFNYEVKAPRDSGTGMVTGRRVQGPVFITKPISVSTPQFFNALVTNEVLKTVQLDFFRPTADGREELYYSIKLSNANIADIRQFTDTDASGKSAQLEDIGFTFQKIEIITAGGVPAQDDWNGPTPR
jgi:type VI secretion system secreted protein Hcp